VSVTNRFNLPQPLVDAVNYGWYVKAGHISVTSLLKSPRQRWLMERHGSDVVEDVSDRIWLLLGSAVHAILQKSHDNHLVEERLRTTVEGWTLTGQADLLDPEMVLSDYKVTSVWSVIHVDHIEWEQQLNVYAWLYQQHGFSVKRVQIVAILRDWQQSKTVEHDYPPRPVKVIEVPLWTLERQEAFVLERVRLHQASETLADDALPECSDEERWARPTVYAVMGRAKRALRLHDTMDAAERHAREVPGARVETRKGLSIRCERYCAVKPWCSQAAEATA
jgi:CRISPR/Cas system-associated exonuclease Cas4 (RecB family)